MKFAVLVIIHVISGKICLHPLKLFNHLKKIYLKLLMAVHHLERCTFRLYVKRTYHIYHVPSLKNTVSICCQLRKKFCRTWYILEFHYIFFRKKHQKLRLATFSKYMTANNLMWSSWLLLVWVRYEILVQNIWYIGIYHEDYALYFQWGKLAARMTATWLVRTAGRVRGRRGVRKFACVSQVLQDSTATATSTSVWPTPAPTGPRAMTESVTTSASVPEEDMVRNTDTDLCVCDEQLWYIVLSMNMYEYVQCRRCIMSGWYHTAVRRCVARRVMWVQRGGGVVVTWDVQGVVGMWDVRVVGWMWDVGSMTRNIRGV